MKEHRKREREVFGSSAESVVLKHVKHWKTGADPATFEAEDFIRARARIIARMALVEFHLKYRQSELGHLNQARDDKTLAYPEYQKLWRPSRGRCFTCAMSSSFSKVGRALDQAQISIVPADNSSTDLKVVVLDKAIPLQATSRPASLVRGIRPASGLPKRQQTSTSVPIFHVSDEYIPLAEGRVRWAEERSLSVREGESMGLTEEMVAGECDSNAGPKNRPKAQSREFPGNGRSPLNNR